jgi:uncharacterized protein (TIRG00374 family)
LSLLSSRWLRLLLGTTVSVLSLYLAFRNVDYRGVWNVLSKADRWFTSLAVCSVAVNTLGKAIRWKSLMGEAGRTIPISKTLGTLLIGQLLNNIIPARIGDLSRAYLIGSLGPGRIFVLGTIVLEKIIDMLLYVLLFLLLLLISPVPSWVSQPAYPFIIIAMSGFMTVVLLTYRQDWLIKCLTWITNWFPQRMKERIAIRIGAGVSSLGILQDRNSNFKVGWWSSLIWGTAVLTNYLVLRALRIDASFTSSLFVLIVLQAGITIPSVPGKIGVFEYLCVLALGIFSVDRTLALSYGVLLHAIVFLPTTIAGLLFLWNTGLPIGRPVTWETATRAG